MKVIVSMVKQGRTWLRQELPHVEVGVNVAARSPKHERLSTLSLMLKHYDHDVDGGANCILIDVDHCISQIRENYNSQIRKKCAHLEGLPRYMILSQTPTLFL